MIRHLMILAMAALVMSGCDVLKNAPTQVEAGGEVCMWIAAEKDTYASFGRAGEEADMNFGYHGTLPVATGPLGMKRVYVDFTRPVFPEGTEIKMAKLELYHPGKNEDGSPDDITINVARILNEPWSPKTLTWNNRPDRGTGAFQDFPLYLRSQAWSGTANIAGYVKEMFTAGATHYGFMLSLPDQVIARQLEKGFYGNNDIRRKQNSLGLAPRLVLLIKLPAGKTTKDIVLPFLSADHDLDRLGREVTTVQFATGPDFPTSWEVSPQR